MYLHGKGKPETPLPSSCLPLPLLLDTARQINWPYSEFLGGSSAQVPGKALSKVRSDVGLNAVPHLFVLDCPCGLLEF